MLCRVWGRVAKPVLTTRVSTEDVVDFNRARPLPRPPCDPPRGRRLPGKLLLRPYDREEDHYSTAQTLRQRRGLLQGSIAALEGRKMTNSLTGLRGVKT